MPIDRLSIPNMEARYGRLYQEHIMIPLS